MHCPKCGSKDRAKAGFVGEKQRWQCKGCPCKYTRSTPKGQSEAVKETALSLYLSGLSFRRIAKLLHVSAVSVLSWIQKTPAAESRLKAGQTTVVELDELCTFLTQKKASYGYGLLFVERRGELLTGKWVVEALER